MITRAIMYGSKVSSKPSPLPITRSNRDFMNVTTSLQLNPIAVVNVVDAFVMTVSICFALLIKWLINATQFSVLLDGYFLK